MKIGSWNTAALLAAVRTKSMKAAPRFAKFLKLANQLSVFCTQETHGQIADINELRRELRHFEIGHSLFPDSAATGGVITCIQPAFAKLFSTISHSSVDMVSDHIPIVVTISTFRPQDDESLWPELLNFVPKLPEVPEEMEEEALAGLVPPTSAGAAPERPALRAGTAPERVALQVPHWEGVLPDNIVDQQLPMVRNPHYGLHVIALGRNGSLFHKYQTGAANTSDPMAQVPMTEWLCLTPAVRKNTSGADLTPRVRQQPGSGVERGWPYRALRYQADSLDLWQMYQTDAKDPGPACVEQAPRALLRPLPAGLPGVPGGGGVQGKLLERRVHVDHEPAGALAEPGRPEAKADVAQLRRPYV
ncbi:unnamed protein product [Prorocentrum cordatum]|uniref:Uncharacterized protein n=1 Tax=Prorocentrum cordatum TaxID=2364126 RepID=A0ABN9WQI4_9DINO|nr:unnamed protein product [Polarella glacialis]